MITPKFTCSQTDDSVIISVYCPAIRASEIEIDVDDTVFILHINPYFLKLNFSKPLIEDDDSSARYDPGSGYLAVTLTKRSKGEDFGDLSLLSTLLARPAPPKAHLIEVVGEAENEEEILVGKLKNISLTQEENDRQFRQEPEIKLSTERNYGFLDAYSGYFRNVSYTENEINELGDEAETCGAQERREKRRTHEDEKWDPEHYMADYADDEHIRELFGWMNPRATNGAFNEEENSAMLRLPRKEYLVSTAQTKQLYLTLVTLIFSYAYEARTTQLDFNPESAWTICSLTPALSALDPPPYTESENGVSKKISDDELRASLNESYRRSLAFPLYRSFSLSEKCREDTANLFSAGQRAILRCLLEIKRILDHHEVYYVYSKIWVDDLCVWTQAYARNEVLRQIGLELSGLVMNKGSIGWRLEEYEEATVTRVAVTPESVDSDDEGPAPLAASIH